MTSKKDAIQGKIDALLNEFDKTRNWNKRITLWGLLLNLYYDRKRVILDERVETRRSTQREVSYDSTIDFEQEKRVKAQN